MTLLAFEFTEKCLMARNPKSSFIGHLDQLDPDASGLDDLLIFEFIEKSWNSYLGISTSWMTFFFEFIEKSQLN